MKQYAAMAICLAATLPAARAAGPETWQEPVTGMSFVAITKGCFRMGSAVPVQPRLDEFWKRIRYTGTISADEVPQHEVCVDAFWMGKFEVRKGEWLQVTGSAVGEGSPALPVAAVTWTQAREFAERLTLLSGGKYRFRLPTEAEWEYACRAGAAEEIVPIGSELVGKSWYGARRAYLPVPHDTGLLAANAFGLHDMLGNVWEWTQDSYLPDGYARHQLYNPKVLAQTAQQVIRGASFRSEPRQMRCAMRGHYDAAQRLDSIGFRLVRE
jgi:formylglycine-generating enzyme required for sulfatase activity